MKFVVEALGLTVAGGKQLALNLLERLAENKSHQFVFLVPDSPGYANLARSGAKCVVCRHRFGLAGRSHLLNHVVRHVCIRERANALLCLGNFPPRATACPTVVLLQNAWIVRSDRVAERRHTLRERLVISYGRRRYRTLPRRTHILVQTPVMRDHLCRRFGIDPCRVAVIPNAIPFPLEPDAPSRRQTPLDPAKPFTFLCLARYYAHKNIKILLDAIQHLPLLTRDRARCLLTIAPEQHPRAARLLRQLATRHLGTSITNLGPVPAEQLPALFRGADALILPTLLESHSRTYLEAMHFGLPIATSDRDFGRHACRDAALYFDTHDARHVAKAMAQLMEDGELRRRLVESGRGIIAQAPGWNDLAARFTRALERAARGECVTEPNAGTPVIAARTQTMEI
jgi:glycosyltransferase involved in cell wall biosynthesis